MSKETFGSFIGTDPTYAGDMSGEALTLSGDLVVNNGQVDGDLTVGGNGQVAGELDVGGDLKLTPNPSTTVPTMAVGQVVPMVSGSTLYFKYQQAATTVLSGAVALS
jgi:hypothetical protein